AIVSKVFLMIVFSLVLFFSAYLTLKRSEDNEIYLFSHPLAQSLKLDGTHFVRGQVESYHVQQVPFAIFTIGIAGILSGLLGIGSGTMKVLAMDHYLKLPYKVATTTSNFMIGITAAVSAGIYFQRGYINPTITFPVLIGAFIGSLCGTKLISRIQVKSLRIIFSITICFVGLQMLYNALEGRT
ncbi:MAG: hypothetical protein ACD_45C00665G0006, partial [uncultured bacterium]